MKEALALHLAALVEDGDAVPHPKGVQAYLEAASDSDGEEYYLTHVIVHDVLPPLVAA
jgi:hypothetical protein